MKTVNARMCVCVCVCNGMLATLSTKKGSSSNNNSKEDRTVS